MEDKEITLLLGLVVLGLLFYICYTKNNKIKITQFTRDDAGRIMEILEK